VYCRDVYVQQSKGFIQRKSSILRPAVKILASELPHAFYPSFRQPIWEIKFPPCLMFSEGVIHIVRVFHCHLPTFKKIQIDDKLSFKADSHIPCHSHAFALPCRSAKALDCLSHLIYTVRPCLIHTYHAVPLPCHEYAFLKATFQGHGRVMA
jgi:hypothetical protein